MKKCSKCVMPDTAETLTFGKNGVCSVCNQIEQKKNIDWDKRAIDLDSLIKKYKDKKTNMIALFLFQEAKTQLLLCGIWLLKKKLTHL